MYITQALNHEINGSPFESQTSPEIQTGENSFFEQMLSATATQQVGNASSAEMSMNKDTQTKQNDAKSNLLAQNDEESEEEETTQFFGSPVSTTDMLSSIASFQRG